MIVKPFEHSQYTVHKQVFKLFGGAFRCYDAAGNLAAYADMKPYKLKEDIRVYSGEDRLNELLVIKARSILDISATYDVFDPAANESVGALRRRGLKSFLRDEWVILDSAEREIGSIVEDSMLMALLRRFVTSWIPQTFHGQVGGAPVFTFAQNFNPFCLRLSLDFSEDSTNQLDRRLGIAAAVLLCAIEGRQQ